MTEPKGPIAYLTAGAGGTFCGSCMHDNTLARAWNQMGLDVQLIPTYTPIRTDEKDVSVNRVFYGGINVFLDQKLSLYRWAPSFLRRILDRPNLIRWVTSRPSAIRAESLGALTLSMLRGRDGNQRREADELCKWLADMQPSLILFTNLLIAGCIPQLRATLDVPIVVTLQGDDAFLEYLSEPFRSGALKELQRLAADVDGFLVHSRYYADFMQEYLGLAPEKLEIVPLGVDVAEFPIPSEEPPSEQPISGGRTIGYLAKMAPEKGLHVLVDAFLELHRRATVKEVRLRIAGWTGPDHHAYVENEMGRLKAAGLAQSVDLLGTVDRKQKLDFYQSIDLLSVPTTYADPKGLFVLEALAAGVPVVQPDHGAFPEMLQQLGGGRLVPPNDPKQLADAIENLLIEDSTRRTMGWNAAHSVHSQRNAHAMAIQTWNALQRFLGS